VAARPRQVPDQAGAERIAGQGEYDWYRGCGPFCCEGKRISRKDNDIDFEADQFGRYLGGTLSTSLGPPVFDRHSMAFAPSELAQLLHDPRNPMVGCLGCCARPASGHIAAAPPSNVMNSRRFIRSTRRRPTECHD